MSRLPQVPGDRVMRALKRAGFLVVRQKGSHCVMRHQTDLSRRCTVPLHASQPVKAGTLHAILKGAGLEVQEFLGLL